MNTAYPQIPYGWADFDSMRRERTLYYAGIRHGYVIELKYLKRSERVQRGEPASEARVARAAQKPRPRCGAMWPSSGWPASTRPCSSPVWRSCSTAGRWSTPKPRPPPAKSQP